MDFIRYYIICGSVFYSHSPQFNYYYGGKHTRVYKTAGKPLKLIIMAYKFEVRKIRYPDHEQLAEVLSEFSNEGWQYVNTLEHDFYGSLNYYIDEILFKKGF